ncbi:histidine kinase [Paenibacillus thiaminolyticus]|uniref:sensor histidine kinase n=1 Tax=Paenibacillus thiaminolyticus TaxID=49283 RepID=UPI002330B2E0|nr:histidine kinase [Paenibacillus thiaminolyticus]WCF07443.1 histidine kinase [Paenibacillus thiaminolyticus]WII36727.1 histidine kinase [Paenibacillus thiaminolyticus]
MNIRTKLFVFIPLLVILVSAVTYFIYFSSRTIQESYNMMMERILLYKQIAQQTEQHLRTLSRYLIDQKETTYDELAIQQEELLAMKANLAKQAETDSNDISVRNYDHMLDSFLEKVEEVLGATDVRGLRSFAVLYEDTEKIAGFIRDQGQSLVDLELSSYQPYYRQILHNTQQMNKIGLALFGVSLLLSMVFVIWLSRSISRPIHMLVRTAKQIAKGNLQIAPPVFRQDDEFRILSEAFRHMLANLRKLIAKDMEHLERERLVKELELRALQSQINPHFLFNTLNALSKLALIEGADRTSDLTVSVSNLLRYNLRKLDTPVTLREEVDNTAEYFSIQQARFRERIRCEMSIEERALGQYIPCLSLQPIVENAFIHGVEGMEEGAAVRVSITRSDTEVTVTIADNGAGMDEATRASLLGEGEADARSRGEAHRSTGLGLQNVFKRLQLFYGRQDIVELESVIGRGTTVRLRLPIYEEVEADVSSVNCG